MVAGSVSAAVVVGSIPGQSGIGANGAATYRIPIEVAAGMNDLKPDVGLSYNSQSGGWLVGAGWSLTGFSTIARCGHSVALDTHVRGVTFSAEDRFCLDGSPLVMITSGGTYGGNNTEYRTEIHGYEKVISKSSQSGGPPDSFEVHQPSGLVYTYGYDTAAGSRIATIGLTTNQTRVWALDTITDKFGNQIKFKYQSPVAGEFVPDEITWTSTGAGTGPYKLKFNYTDLTSTLPSAVRGGYLWGSQWQATRRLNTIDYTYNGTRVHLYTLSYSSGSSGRSQLTGIQQCGSGGTSGNCLPVTAINWETTQVSFATIPESGPVTAAYDDAVVADINGDGAVDMYVPIAVSGTLKWHIVLATPQSGQLGEVGAFSTGFTVYGTKGGQALDFDGDGRQDLLAEGANGNWYVYLRSANSRCGNTIVCDTGIAVTQNQKIIVLDATGDGLSDLVVADVNGDSFLYKNIGDLNLGVFLAAAQAISPQLVGDFFRSVIGQTDIDGDGREDMLQMLIIPRVGQVYPGQVVISVSRSYWNSAASSPHDDFTTESQAYAGWGEGSIRQPAVADINGDGLSDIVFYSNSTSQWVTMLSKGSSFAPAQSTGISANPATFGDVNGDGRADLVMPCTGSTGWCAYLSDGTGYSSGSTPVNLGGPTPSQVTKQFLVDTSGDGLADFVAVKNINPTNGWEVWVHQGASGDLVDKTTDGLGNTFDPSYTPLNLASYEVTGSGTPPTQRLIRGSSLAVVSSAAVSTGIGSGTYTTSYTYSTGLQDMTGRGFLGFAKMTATDSRNSLATATEYSQIFPYAGRQGKITVKNGANLVSESDPSWTKNTLLGVADSIHTAGQYHFVHLDQRVDKAYGVDAAAGQLVRTMTTDTTFIAPNDWDYTQGAPRRQMVTVDPEVGDTLTTTTDRTFATLTGVWCLGLPSTVAINKSNGSANSTRNVAYTYTSDNKCRVETETVGTTVAKQLKTTYTYKSTGQLDTRTEDSGDLTADDRKTTFNYATAPYFRPTQEIHTAGGVNYTVGHVWDDAQGLEVGLTTAQGEASMWEYDDFGQLITELRPAGLSLGGTTGYGQSTIIRSACGTCWPANAKFKVRETRSDGSWSESYRDALNREVGQASTLISGSVESRQAFAYNALGQVVTATVPYRSDTTPADVTKTYDLLGRPKSESRQVSEADTSVQTTTWVYNGQSVTVTDAEEHARTFSTDGEGRLVSVQESSPSGPTVVYGYTPWGELNSVTDASGHTTTTMSYDERGFRTDVVDQDAGSGTYEYTAWGELYRARDARTGSSNWTLSNTYDALGRLTNRVDYDPVAATSATSTWEYYTTTNAGTGARRGLLYRARSFDASSTLQYEEVNKYNEVAGLQVSRVQSVVKINGAPQSSYTTDYQYDGEGRLQHMIYPTTVSARPQFDYTYSRGYLDTVQQTQGSTYPRYDLVSLDAVGRPTGVQLGNALLDVQAEYDRVNLLVKTIKSGPPSPGTATQNLAYTWDKVGNLKTRQDLNQTGTPTYLTEVFTYDALNRLDAGALNGVTNQDTQYTADGNLTKKTMADNYEFYYFYNTPGKPHAVSKVERSYDCGCGGPCHVTDTYTYDATGNMVSRLGASGNRYVTWTAFSKPKQISLGNASCTGDCTTFTYGPDRQLIKQVDTKGSTTRTVYYVGPHFEIEVSSGNTQYRSHAFANSQVIFTQVEDANTWQSYYPLRDHLGSVDKQYVAMGGGTNPLAYSYDAFGRRRNTNWTNDGAGAQMVATSWNHQGYTGHEMLDTAQLIHMQGRVYDPTLGRFLSPDPVLGQLGSPQSLNAYSYVGNNPLTFYDPTGLFTCDPMTPPEACAGIVVTAPPWIEYDFMRPNPGFYTVVPVAPLVPSSLAPVPGDANLPEGLTVQSAIQDKIDTITVTGKRILSNFTYYDFVDLSVQMAFFSLDILTPFDGIGPETLLGIGVVGTLRAGRAVSALSKTGQVADRGGLTKAGRALAKHGGRDGSVFPRPTGNPTSINRQGQSMLDDILGNTSRTNQNKFGGSDYFGGSRGGGARFDRQGNFMGFLEP